MQSLHHLYDETERTLYVGYLRTRTAAVDAMKGQGLVEYALILALIAIVVLVSLAFFGDQLNNTYERVNCGVYGAASLGLQGQNCATPP